MPIDCYREILNRADKDDVEFGRAWYQTANMQICKIADETGYSKERVAGVVAVLSPMVEWNLNLRSARNFLRSKGKAKGIPGFRKNIQKAKQVLKGNFAVIKGEKVKAFYCTLLNPNHAEPVIDTQMIAAFYKGKAYRDDLKIVFQAKKRREPIRQAIFELANEKGWTVAETQAVIWTTFKRLNGPYADQLKLWNGSIWKRRVNS